MDWETKCKCLEKLCKSFNTTWVLHPKNPGESWLLTSEWRPRLNPGVSLGVGGITVAAYSKGGVKYASWEKDFGKDVVWSQQLPTNQNIENINLSALHTRIEKIHISFTLIGEYGKDDLYKLAKNMKYPPNDAEYPGFEEKFAEAWICLVKDYVVCIHDFLNTYKIPAFIAYIPSENGEPLGIDVIALNKILSHDEITRFRVSLPVEFSLKGLPTFATPIKSKTIPVQKITQGLPRMFRGGPIKSHNLHPRYQGSKYPAEIMSFLMYQYLATLAPPKTCILDTVIFTSPVFFNTKEEFHTYLASMAETVRKQSENCDLVGFGTSGGFHIYPCIFDKRKNTLEVFLERLEEAPALIAWVAHTFGVQRREIKYLSPFHDLDIQKFEEGWSSGPDAAKVTHITKGVGQCAYWVYRYLYRRLILRCTLEETILYFKEAVKDRVSLIQSLQSFVAILTTRAVAFGEAGMVDKDSEIAELLKSEKDIPMDVPCDADPKTIKYARSARDAYSSDSDSDASAKPHAGAGHEYEDSDLDSDYSYSSYSDSSDLDMSDDEL